MARVLTVPFRVSATEAAERLARAQEPPGVLRVLRRSGAERHAAPARPAYLPLVVYRVEASARYVATVGTYKFRLRERRGAASGLAAVPHFERYVAWETVRGAVPPTEYAPESPLCQAYAGAEYSAAEHEWVLKSADYLRVATTSASRGPAVGNAFAVPADALRQRVLSAVSADLAAKARATLHAGRHRRQWAQRPDVVGTVAIEALRVLRADRLSLYVPAYVWRHERHIVSICNAYDGAVSAKRLYSPWRAAAAAAAVGAAFQTPALGLWTGGACAALAAAWARYWPVAAALARDWVRRAQLAWWRRATAGARAHDAGAGANANSSAGAGAGKFRDANGSSDAAVPDPYAVLGVSRDASDAEIKRAFRACAKRSHPDRVHGSDEAQRAEATRDFRRALRAYQMVRDANKGTTPGGAQR